MTYFLFMFFFCFEVGDKTDSRHIPPVTKYIPGYALLYANLGEFYLRGYLKLEVTGHAEDSPLYTRTSGRSSECSNEAKDFTYGE